MRKKPAKLPRTGTRLAACPFCGQAASRCMIDSPVEARRLFGVDCPNPECLVVRTGWCATIAEAEALWNTRASAPKERR